MWEAGTDSALLQEKHHSQPDRGYVLLRSSNLVSLGRDSMSIEYYSNTITPSLNSVPKTNFLLTSDLPPSRQDNLQWTRPYTLCLLAYETFYLAGARGASPLSIPVDLDLSSLSSHHQPHRAILRETSGTIYISQAEGEMGRRSCRLVFTLGFMLMRKQL